MAGKGPGAGRRTRWWSIADPARAWANVFHNVAFFLVVFSDAPWLWVGLVGIVAVVLVQLRVWGKALEASLGNMAGVTFAMWLVRVTGHRDDASPNIGRAILIVATEVIVTMIAVSLARWRRERLTPPGAES